MSTNHEVTLNSEAATSGSHCSRGTAKRWRSRRASPSSSTAPQMPVTARNCQGGTSPTMIFIAGQLRPQPSATPISMTRPKPRDGTPLAPNALTRDRRHVLRLGIPREVDPGVLAHLGDVGIDQRPALG